MANKILLKRSNVLTSDGKPKLPEASAMSYGEIAVNYAAGNETISIKNSNDEIVTFSSDNNPNGGTNKKPDIYYIEINQRVSDPYTMITSAITDSKRSVIEAIRNNSHRYLGKYVSGDDMMYLCQLDDSDSTKFNEDGSSASLNGSQGNVFMKLPRFYYKAEFINNNWRIGFSLEEVDKSWKCWYGNDLIGAFMASNGVSSITNSGIYENSWFQSKYELQRKYRHHGKLTTWEEHCIMCFLFYAYYCHTNCKAQCGSGESASYAFGVQLSMNDTTPESNTYYNGLNFWGLENWWGYQWELIDNASGHSGETINNRLAIKQYDNRTGVETDTRFIEASGTTSYITNMTIGEYLDTSSVSFNTGSTTTYYCATFNTDTTRPNIVLNRGGNDSYERNNIALISSIGYVEGGQHMRLSFVGPWEELSVADFKNITKFY